MIVRDEGPDDQAAVREIVSAAFGRVDEALLVDRLRADGDTEIALVATDGDTLLGHIAFSRMDAPFRALGLAPVSVLPLQQGKGIGAMLIREGLARAQRDGWQGIFVLGEPEYYQRFGFDPALAVGFTSPYAGPYLMAQALGGPLPVTTGEVAYAPAFSALG